MRTGIIAKKLGMTRFFREDGSNVPVTLIGVEKNYVTRVKEISPKNLKQIQIASGNIKVKKITKQSLHRYQEKEKEKGMGIFSFLIVLIMFVAAIILFLDTFKNQFIHFWPELDNYLIYIFETLNNIYQEKMTPKPILNLDIIIQY